MFMPIIYRVSPPDAKQQHFTSAPPSSGCFQLALSLSAAQQEDGHSSFPSSMSGSSVKESFSKASTHAGSLTPWLQTITPLRADAEIDSCVYSQSICTITAVCFMVSMFLAATATTRLLPLSFRVK